LERVSTEMSLHVLAYNLKRVTKLLGIRGLIDAVRAFGRFLLLSLWCESARLAMLLSAHLKKAICGREFAHFPVLST
jgi:hypothetical protein